MSVDRLRVILIGGTSHAGKSTLAGTLAEQLGWEHLSTDHLASHPGRPWRPRPDMLPPHVTAHYLTLGVDELVASVLTHYRETVWPLAENLIREHAEQPSARRLVLEGSALLPRKVAGLGIGGVAALWLTGEAGLFERRIRARSRYEATADIGRAAIDKFTQRTLAFDRVIMDEVARLDLPRLDVGDGIAVDTLAALCLDRARAQLSPA